MPRNNTSLLNHNTLFPMPAPMHETSILADRNNRNKSPILAKQRIVKKVKPDMRKTIYATETKDDGFFSHRFSM